MHHRPSAPKSGLSILTALLMAVSLALIAPTASAAPAQPRGLTPSLTSQSDAPVLTWERVSGATSYRVQVSDEPSFAKPRYNVTTSNRHATPTTQLPFGTVWWRVQAVGPTGTSDWSTTSYDRQALAGPELKSPEDEAVLDQPEEPVLLAWHPIEGATGYTIEIDQDTDFIGATKYTTKTSSFVVPNPQIATDYNWRVTATLASGVVTLPSDPRVYRIGGLEKPTIVRPVDKPETDDDETDVEDVILEWSPVKGAKTYDLQVSTDENFPAESMVANLTALKGTSWSPTKTLQNDQYFWRVRPLDAQGNKLDWGQVDIWQFRRYWPDQPQLEYPAYNAVVGDPFFYQWTPVDKAASYQLELSETIDFSQKADTCYTVHTTYVPTGNGDCFPSAYGTYYWRVIALDRYGSSSLSARTEESEPVPAEKGRFSYAPDVVDLASATPADASTVSVPTLEWDPVPGAARYRVYITAVDGGGNSVNGAITTGTSYTPRKKLTVGKSYRWWVQTLSQSGRPGATLLPEAQSVFTVGEQGPATAAVPEQTSPDMGTDVSRFPTVTWEPVDGAAYYRLGIRPADTVQAFILLSDRFEYPAGEDVSASWLTPETLEWIVVAYDGAHTKIGESSAPRTLQMVSLPEAQGPRAALTGTAGWSDATSCLEALPDRCEDLRQTPVLRWDDVPGAGGYRLWLSRDAGMTNVMSGFPKDIDTNMWMSPPALIDAQAGDAFYWQVQPCTAPGVCRPMTVSPWAFNKKSNPVQLIAPADGATEDATTENDITFEWVDYLETNLRDDASGDNLDSTGVKPRISAMHYVVEVSTVPNFQTLVDTIKVDQTSYTAYTKTYPEGTLYWRVATYDGSNNRLSNSETRTFVKSSPVPEPGWPSAGQEVSQTEAFRWSGVDFSGSYDIEVFRNGDTVGQTANRVFSGNSKQLAFTTTTPLPVSEEPYTWRIRRRDADNREGEWSGFATFQVSGDAPGLLNPAASAQVEADGALFTWEGTSEATSYRFERRLVGSTSTTENVTTVGRAWAPTRTITDGVWEWRVTSLDAAGKVRESSPWRRFSVDGTAPSVQSTAPTGSAKAKSNFKATFSEPVTNVTPSTFTITQKGSRKARPAVVKLKNGGTKAILNPKKNLKRKKVYIVKLSPSITDGAGLAIPPTKWKVKIR